MLAISENAGAVRSDVLTEKTRRHLVLADHAREGLVRAGRQAESVIVGNRPAGKAGLMTGGIECIGGDGLIRLDEENNLPPASEIALEKSASAFVSTRSGCSGSQ